jgi:hypothetical protein
MKSKNLKVIIGVEIALIVCLCICGIGGVVYYSGSAQTAAGGGSQPPTQPVAAATATQPPTETPTPSPLGTALERLPDGTSKFTDFDAGFEMTIPAGWLAVRPDNTEDVNAALAIKNTMLRDQVDSDMAAYETKKDRLFIYPLRPDIQKDVIFGFSKLTWSDSDTQAIDNAVMGRLVRELESSGAIPGFRATTSQIFKNDNGVSVMVIKGRFSMSDGQGGSIPFVATLLFFKPTPTSLNRITFTFVQDYDAQISPDVNFMMESIRLLE